MTTLVSVTRRSAVVALVAGLAMALLLSTGVDRAVRTVPTAQQLLAYTPATGAIFNRPVGGVAEQRAIFSHVNKTIDATPPGATIRFAIYSFAEESTATRLINAYRRGVHVQLIFNAHKVYAQERRLQAVLGRNPNRRSFAMFCEGSCRGVKGQMHQKVFLFSKAGAAENVVMVGSNNMTRNNAVNQWSDIYTVTGDPALYFTYAGVFDQMKADVPQTRPFISARVNSFGPDFYPYPRVSQADDPLYQALSNISCTGAAEGYGALSATDVDGNGLLDDRVTVLRIAQHAWNGERGVYLAQKVAQLYQSGCDVKVIYGVGIGRVVKNSLARAGVPMTGGRTKKKTHQKLMFLSGVYEGDPASALVWNGSHNWSDGALRRDDVVLRVDSLDAFNQYNANFEDIWANG